ncbi:hypothetical protein BH11BAC1_BH11BAC1_26020 [soil metagenome]
MKAYQSIDDYISAQSPEMKPKLELIRQTIQKLVPEAEEVISYGMAAFRYHGMLAYFAAFKNHYSFFFGPAVTKAFLKDLVSYETSKATIKIPKEKAVPVQLLKRLTKYAAALNIGKAKLKEKEKKIVAKKKK